MDVISVALGFMDNLNAFVFTLLCPEFYKLRSIESRKIKIGDLIAHKDITVHQYKLIREFHSKRLSRFRRSLLKPIFYLTKSWELFKYLVAKKLKKDYNLDKSEIYMFTESLIITVKDAKYLLQKASDKYIDKKYLEEFILSRTPKKRVYYIS